MLISESNQALFEGLSAWDKAAFWAVLSEQLAKQLLADNQATEDWRNVTRELLSAVNEKDIAKIESLAAIIESDDEATSLTTQPILYEASQDAALCNFMVDTTQSSISTLYEAGLVEDVPGWFSERVLDIWDWVESHAEKTHTKPLVRKLLGFYAVVRFSAYSRNGVL